VTCRGNDRKEIFRDAEDRKVFQEKLRHSLEIFNVSLLTYACMSNHFHLLVATPEGNLSEFMRHFNISYTSAFNRKYRRSGHLYQGRYKAFLIDEDNYLLEVSRYIHLNPFRLKSGGSVDKRWKELLGSDSTSLPGYLSERKRKGYVNYGVVLEHLGGDNREGMLAYRHFVEEGIGIAGSPLALGKGNGIVGDGGFVARVKRKFGKGGDSLREQPSLRGLRRDLTPEALISRYLELTGEPREQICRRGRQSLERAMLMELLYRFCRITQPEIGKLLGGIDYSAVSQSRKRFQAKLEQEPELRQRYENIRDHIGET
jgi:REP element-mobilizing transposase RayT